MAKAAKKAVRKKRKERKNVEKGQAHIQATFNNTLVTLTDMAVTHFHGQAQVHWASEDQESQHRLLHSPLQKKLQRELWSTVLKQLKYT